MADRITVFNSKELQGTILLMRGAGREVAKEIRGRTKSVIDPVWKDAVKLNASTTLERQVLAATARTAISDQNVTLSVASVGKALKGGAKPVDIVAGVEFGSKNYKQFKGRNRKGYVVMPAVADVIPRIASLWIQTVVKTFYEILERK